MIRPPEEERIKRRKPGEEEDTRTPMQLLVAFVKQTMDSIRSTLTGRTGEVQKQVARRSLPLEERMKQARTKQLTESELEALLNDPSPLVRVELVHNDTISGDALEILKRDPDVTVSTIARRKQFELQMQ